MGRWVGGWVGGRTYRSVRPGLVRWDFAKGDMISGCSVMNAGLMMSSCMGRGGWVDGWVGGWVGG